MDLPIEQVREIVERALAEDIGSGDITTAATIDAPITGRAIILAKAPGVIAGLPVASEAFLALDFCIEFSALIKDGERVAPGTKAAEITGCLAPILTAERTALNFLMRMSGIATLTHRFVDAVAGTSTKILDTRKTAPGLRLLDKYAVRMGGGQNHRFGLYDGVLIKDNHIAAAGGIPQAIERVRRTSLQAAKIEVECMNLEEVQQALCAKADILLLDNMDLATLTEGVKMVAGRAKVEASGNIGLENVRAVAETGVDFISIGKLTHSAPALDFSLEIATS